MVASPINLEKIRCQKILRMRAIAAILSISLLWTQLFTPMHAIANDSGNDDSHYLAKQKLQLIENHKNIEKQRIELAYKNAIERKKAMNRQATTSHSRTDRQLQNLIKRFIAILKATPSTLILPITGAIKNAQVYQQHYSDPYFPDIRENASIYPDTDGKSPVQYKESFHSWIQYLQTIADKALHSSGPDLSDLPDLNEMTQWPAINRIANNELTVAHFEAHGRYLADLVFGPRSYVHHLSNTYYKSTDIDQSMKVDQSEASSPYRSNTIYEKDHDAEILAHYLRFLDLIDAQAQVYSDPRYLNSQFDQLEALNRVQWQASPSPSFYRYIENLANFKPGYLPLIPTLLGMCAIMMIDSNYRFAVDPLGKITLTILPSLAFYATSLMLMVMGHSAFNKTYKLLHSHLAASARQKHFLLGFMARGKELNPNIFSSEKAQKLLKSLWQQTGNPQFSYQLLRGVTCELSLMNTANALAIASDAAALTPPSDFQNTQAPTGVRIDATPAEERESDTDDVANREVDVEMRSKANSSKKP